MFPLKMAKTLIIIPKATPFNKSKKTTAANVAMKGTNWYFPLFQKCLKVAGLANLYPTNSRMAASVANGILFKITGMVNTLMSKRTP